MGRSTPASGYHLQKGMTGLLDGRPSSGARRRTGGTTMTAPPTLDEQGAQHLFEEVLDLWIHPEIERRRAAGLLPDDFLVYKAQVVLNLDAPTQVRLNHEVVAAARLKVNRPIRKGEIVTVGDVDEIADIQLTDLDPNAGHVTLVLLRDTWHIRFDFRYNAARITAMLDTARQFLDCASVALEKEHLRAFVDNLFSATELMAKGELLQSHEEFLTSKKHDLVFVRYSHWSYLGNADQRYAQLL
jgi:hypothetical protein